MKIREAVKDDILVWSKYRTLLWPDTEDGHRGEIDEYFNGTAIDIEITLVIENDSEEMVGFIELNIRNFAEQSREASIPYVEGWYIDEAYQNRGYGKALMTAAEEWAKKLGYKELASDAEIDNLKSIEIHNKLGFMETERIVCFLKKLK